MLKSHGCIAAVTSFFIYLLIFDSHFWKKKKKTSERQKCSFSSSTSEADSPIDNTVYRRRRQAMWRILRFISSSEAADATVVANDFICPSLFLLSFLLVFQKNQSRMWKFRSSLPNTAGGGARLFLSLLSLSNGNALKVMLQACIVSHLPVSDCSCFCSSNKEWGNVEWCRCCCYVTSERWH